MVVETKSLTKADTGNIYVDSEYQDAVYYFEDMQAGAQGSWADMKQGRWIPTGTWLPPLFSRMLAHGGIQPTLEIGFPSSINAI